MSEFVTEKELDREEAAFQCMDEEVYVMDEAVHDKELRIYRRLRATLREAVRLLDALARSPCKAYGYPNYYIEPRQDAAIEFLRAFEGEASDE